MLVWLTVISQKLVDLAFEILPQKVPDQQALSACKIISHRGEHDNKTVLENTLPAFDLAADAGVWGIECDIRWTKDLVPVVSHDPSGDRLFGRPDKLADLSYTEVKELFPLIPTMVELIERFGSKVHLMLEIKDEYYPDPEQQKDILRQLLMGLTPGVDYHFLALDPVLFEKVDFVPSKFHFPVADTNFSSLSQLSVDMNLGGLTGHYLLLSNELKRRHELAGQKIGTGFISSKNCLFRELNRGIEWIFSNNAVKLQKILDSHLTG
jgi:glycerophosphoryl diester phosphodiesterase